MSPPRCPRCGGLVTEDAEWCGQCLAPLREPQEAEPAAEVIPEVVPQEPERPPDERRAPAPDEPAEGASVRRVGDRMVWSCPTCGLDNSIEAMACERCGTLFAELFPEEEGGRSVDPGRARTLSLFLPGAGHAAAGRVGEGVARAVLFLWALGSGVGIFVAGGSGEGRGALRPLAVLYLIAVGILYGVSVIDAGRAAEDRPPVLSWRMLLFGVSGLVLVTLVIFMISGFASLGSPGG